MKLSAPGSLRLDRERLLQDVHDRLKERMPGLDASNPDPTDPGWLLMEQATWLAEQLSAELDRYPLSVLQQFLHLVGAEIEPAVPSLAVLSVVPREAGTMRVTRDRPADWRFFTPQTEDRDPIEFVLAEPEAPVAPMTARGIWWWDGTQLAEVTDADTNRADGAEGQVIQSGKPARSPAFDNERIDYRLIVTDPESALEQVNSAIAKLDEGNGAWLSLQAQRDGASGILIEARVTPNRALERAAGGSTAPGGDLLVPWEPIEGSTWTPPVRFVASPRLPLRLRGAEPMPGPEDGTLLVKNLPANILLSNLFEAAAAPLPRPVIDGIWNAIRRRDARLGGLRPTVTRTLEPTREGQPAPWIRAVVSANAWAHLTGTTPRAFTYVELPAAPRTEMTIRLALQWARPADTESMEVWALDGDGISEQPIPARESWTLPVPSLVDSQGLDHMQAVDIDVAPGQRGVLISTPQRPTAVLPNAIMVINAPLVPDGRDLVVERAVPEAASLLEEDIVGVEVMARLLRQPLGESSRAALSKLPLAHFTLPLGETIDDFSGIGLDEPAGRIVFNAPDHEGVVRDLRPNTVINLEWYRRTDGSVGEVEQGAIRYVEQAPSTRPHLTDCYNHAGAWFGSERETEIAARERMFSPTSDIPVVPGDWERAIRRELGARGRGWVVRCWGHTERSLLSGALWPLDNPDDEPETCRFHDALANAGPEVLTVVLGPKHELLGMPELDAARRVVESLIQRVRRRVPTIQRAVVTRFWPLTLETQERASQPLPCFSGPDLWGKGTLVGPQGRRLEPSDASLMLNAAVVEVVEVTE